VFKPLPAAESALPDNLQQQQQQLLRALTYRTINDLLEGSCRGSGLQLLVMPLGLQDVLQDVMPDAGLTGALATVSWGLFRYVLCPWVLTLYCAARGAADGAARRAAGCDAGCRADRCVERF
jgi:hypothetical protein